MLSAEAVQTLVTLGAAAPQPVSAPDGGSHLLVPAGYSLQKIPPLEQPLQRIRQQVIVHDSESFVAYVNRYKSAQSRLFAEPGFLTRDGEAIVTGVLDYHEPEDKPHYGAHVVTYQPRYSTQWKTWSEACSEPMRQAEFAEFIEENRKDITDPNAANLLDVVRTFKANKKVDFDSVVYQPNNSVMLSYSENVQQQGQSGVLPEVMKLGIPVYFRGSLYEVPVFVRYRLGGGGVQFQLKRDRADVIEDDAFGEMTDAIGTATDIEVYLGRRV